MSCARLIIQIGGFAASPPSTFGGYMKIKAKLKKFSDVLVDLVKVIFVTFVIGRFITPDIISEKEALAGAIIAHLILLLAIIMIPEEENKK